MLRDHTIRRVTKRTYDQYNYSDYAYSSSLDNLNPLNPTQLESQFTEIIHAAQKKVVEAYNKANKKVPEDIFSPDVSPAMLLSNIDSLLRSLKGNPLVDLYGDLNNWDVLAGLLNGGDVTDNLLGNPLKLDCSGVLTSSNDELNEELDNLTEDEYDQLFGEDGLGINITYYGLAENEDPSPYPGYIVERDCPLELAAPKEIPEIYKNQEVVFAGWYYDKDFYKKIPNSKLEWPGMNISVYARFWTTAEALADETSSMLQPGLDDLGEPSADTNCELIELAFLRVILIIITVAKTLIDTIVTVVSILKTAADFAKDAQLCWINPPCLSSLIGGVMQKLAALMFQIIGQVLLKLWSMLNLDCITANSANMIDQVNSALAGISNIFGEIDALSISLSEGNIGQSIRDAIKNLKNQVVEQCSTFFSSFGDTIKDSIASGIQSGREAFANPILSLSMVPPEIKEDVNQNIDAIKDSINQIKNLQESINKLSNRNNNGIENEIPKGVEVRSF